MFKAVVVTADEADKATELAAELTLAASRQLELASAIQEELELSGEIQVAKLRQLVRTQREIGTLRLALRKLSAS